jgi:hypothetical protein
MIDWNKPLQTRDGRPARVICTDAKGRYPIVALVDDPRNGQLVVVRTTEGFLDPAFPNHYSDLVNVPPVRECREAWINTYEKSLGECVHPTRAEADAEATTARLACIHLTFSFAKGDGL